VGITQASTSNLFQKSKDHEKNAVVHSRLALNDYHTFE